MDNKNENIGSNFIIGILLLAAGLFLLTQQTDVTMIWHQWRFGSINIASGLILIPFIIGLIILFYNPKSLFGKILTTIGIIIIVATIIMSVNIVFRKTTLYNFIIMLALIAAGAGFLLRWFLKRKN